MFRAFCGLLFKHHLIARVPCGAGMSTPAEVEAALSATGRSAAAGHKRKAPEATPTVAPAALSADWPPHQSYVGPATLVRAASPQLPPP